MGRLIPEERADGRTRCVQDGAIVVADARARKGVYTLEGKRAVYTCTGSHARTVVFGLITYNGRSLFRQYDRFAKDEFADFLREAHAQFGWPIMMILDRAPQHKAKIIRGRSRIWARRSSWNYSPPDCPDFNAIKEVWHQMKHAVLDIVPCVTVAGMHEDVDRWLGSSVPVLGMEKYLCWMV